MAAVLTWLRIYLKSTYREESDRRYGGRRREEGRREEEHTRLSQYGPELQLWLQKHKQQQYLQ
jgi:hypothetical protein